jgi:hypothetical protein
MNDYEFIGYVFPGDDRVYCEDHAKTCSLDLFTGEKRIYPWSECDLCWLEDAGLFNDDDYGVW